MAEESILVFSKEPAVVWKTVIPRCSNSSTDRTTSPVFSLLGVTWELELLTFSLDKFYFSAHLRRIGNEPPSTPFTVMTFIQTTDSVEDGSPLQSQSYRKTITDGVRTLVTRYINLGGASNFDSGTEVTVVCVFTDMPSSTSGIPHETVEVMTQTDLDAPLPLDANLDNLSRDLGKLLEDKVIPDVNLRCGDQTVASHKAILAARSQVFSAMFQSRMLESETGVVDIADVDAQVLELFLKYVYSGKLPDVSDELLSSLYSAADKYAIGSLKTACSERMVNNLTRENCLNVLLLANRHSDKDFKNAIFNFILNHMEILKSQEWDRFCTENHVLSIEVFQTVFNRSFLS